MDDPRRRTPGTHTVLADPRLAEVTARLGHARVKQEVVAVLADCRAGRVPPEAVPDAVLDALPPTGASLRPVVNATGVLVHTNLGRAPLSDAAVEALRVAAGTTDVELDLATGRRGRRGAAALAALAARVPDAEAVHVVNNGAGALGLTALALAADREIVVARGELVEIGDGFRIPDLLESTGARLREVGTTNRVRAEEYAAAVGERTGFVLKVHPSNFRVEGFTSTAEVAELARLLAGTGVPLVVDIGSGLLSRHPRLPDEPDATSVLRAGADLVTASGDKLLGGPQCGLLLGRADLVERLRRFPFARALRVDKLTLAALEATLTGPEPPVARALDADAAALLVRAERICAVLRREGPAGHGDWARAEPSQAQVGGGGAPGVVLPSAAVVLPPGLATPLRTGTPPVVGRVHHARLHLDLVAVDPRQDDVLVDAVRTAVGADPGVLEG